MLEKLKIKLFADGADISEIKELSKNELIKGFTTNPSLMKKSGVKDYKKFAQDITKIIVDKPISFEVFADDLGEMEKQALEIAKWGNNINVNFTHIICGRFHNGWIKLHHNCFTIKS